ncbi:hypothetical protein [Nocardiopsis xinjiangensis]|uniref:hypothetical protein n=1 Tax=Nocardiopsis xinjiangensis TaxID=124285 RepID=UPI000345D432|nr:hypothetical protein [Nocardiopsis xinjiangensis]
MSLSQRIAAGLTVGAAALAIPFAASPASAAEWEKAAGFPGHAECLVEGALYMDDDYHDYTEFHCEQGSSGMWIMWVR